MSMSVLSFLRSRHDLARVLAFFGVALLCGALPVGCATTPHHLWSRGPFKPNAEMLAELSRVHVITVFGPSGRANGVRAPVDDEMSLLYVTVGHVLDGTLSDRFFVNLQPGKVNRVVAADIPGGWHEGVAVVSTLAYEGEPQGPPRPRREIWRPSAPLPPGQEVYLVAHPNVVNAELTALNPLSPFDPVVLPATVRNQTPCDGGGPTLLYVHLRDDVNLLGMSGAACVVWDEKEDRPVIVGLMSGVIERGVGVVVRPVGIVADEPLRADQVR